MLYNLALEANNNGDFFPIWGTCLGFELLLYLAAGKTSHLTSCKSNDRALKLSFLTGNNNNHSKHFVFRAQIRNAFHFADASGSRLFRKAPKDVMAALATQNTTSNFHHWCMTRANMTKSGLDNFFTSLATSLDDDKLEFIAAIEANRYPIWGVQFHPEKNIYEWKLKSIPHSPSSIAVGQYFAQFFVNQGKVSKIFKKLITILMAFSGSSTKEYPPLCLPKRRKPELNLQSSTHLHRECIK